MLKTYRFPVGTAIAAAVSLILAGAAHAQAPAATEEAGKLEEVIVTGTKRAESSQEVPISISAISAAELSRTQINDVRALGAVQDWCCPPPRASTPLAAACAVPAPTSSS